VSSADAGHPFEADADAGWAAELALRFAARGERTELVERRHHGPLRVQRPFHPEPSGTCHVYVLHPPGGVVGGDRLALDAEVESGGRALLTAPAATKLYRSAGARAFVQQTLRVAEGAHLEWLPHETIAFSAARAELTTRVELQPGARFLGWETLCLGRPASGERFERGEVRQRIEIVMGGKLAYCERGSYAAGGDVLSAAWGLRGQPVTGTLIAAGVDLSKHIEELRLAYGVLEGPALAAVSCMGDLCVARYLGPSTEQARGCFLKLWEVLRPLVCGVPAIQPRIWAT
jgi:urease accessory protein